MNYLLIACALLLLASSVAVAQDEPAYNKPAFRKPKLGEFWYGMYRPDGSAEGYSRLKFSETKQQGLHCEWELHISGEGWTYEETRQISFDAGFKLSYSEIQSGGKRILAAREGKVMVGKSGVDDLRAEVSDDAITGMGFILAACAQPEQGAKFSRTEYNEAQDLKDLGATSFACVGQEEIELPEGKVMAWKFTMQRHAKTAALPIWVNDTREIVQIDWGDGNLMKLHREKTEALFKPAPPFLQQLEPEDKTKLVLTADFHGFKLDEMWKLWATAEGLTKWWPQEAEVGDKVGGKYQPTWRNQEGEIVWQLLGEIEIWEPNRKLGFTWKWNTDPAEAPALHVVVEFKEVAEGVKVTITHSSFDPNNDDQQNRSSLHQGWEQFCVKLAALKK